MAGRLFVVVGDTSVARRCVNALGARSLPVLHLGAPSDNELRDALAHHARGVAILTHSDVTSLRYALAAAHMGAQIPLIACIFDRTIGEQLSVLLPQCHLTSPAELAATPSRECRRRRPGCRCVRRDLRLPPLRTVDLVRQAGVRRS